MGLANGPGNLGAQRRREVGRAFLITVGAALFLLGCYGVDLWLSHFLAYP
jgi:hypothetical protein